MRQLAECRLRAGLGIADLNAWMVRQGQAVAYRRFSTEYGSAGTAARNERVGLWQGGFDLPWDWRSGERRILEGGKPGAAAVRQEDCRIKANITSRGKRIYHLPGRQHYERTRIRAEHGERWFCSEAEAQASGWRRAKR